MAKEEIFLKKVELDDKDDALKFKQEYIEDVDANGTEIAGEGGLIRDNLSFEDWFDKIQKNSNLKTLPANRVLGDHFLTIRKSDNKIVAMINVRWELNEILKIHGGHIGYCVRPSERKKGYAATQLNMVLDMFRQKGYKKVLITCKDFNIASAKTIQKCGGVYENSVEANSFVFKRFWIHLTK